MTALTRGDWLDELLTPTQRADVVIRSAELVERLADEAKARQVRKPLDSVSPSGGEQNKPPSKTTDELGRIAGVSGTTIEGGNPNFRNSVTDATKLSTQEIFAHNKERIHLSESLRRLALDLLYDLMADQLDSEILFELAWLKKYNSTAMVVRRSLTDEGVEKLVNVLVDRQSVPTIGFFRKYGRRHAA